MMVVDFFSGTRNEPLGDTKAGVSDDLDALAAYIESLEEVDDSPLNSNDGLSEQALQGQLIFIEKDCSSCHKDNVFTDSLEGERHDIGTITTASGDRDFGFLDGLDTPTLLGLWTSAPYLHDGSATTVQEAILAHSNTVVSQGEADSITRFLHELSTSTPPPINNGEVLELEAEDAELFGNLRKVNATEASGGVFVEAPEGSGNFYYGNNSNGITFRFNVVTAGNYELKTTVRADDYWSDSFWIKVNGYPGRYGHRWNFGVTPTFTERTLTNNARPGYQQNLRFALSEGENVVTFYPREDGVQIDKARIVLQ